MSKTPLPSQAATMARAKGRWVEIAALTAPSLTDAVSAGGYHVACPHPGHGNSSDGFRVYKDFPESGGGVCNTCGNYPYGLKLLAWLKGYSLNDACYDVMHTLDLLDGGKVPVEMVKQIPKPVFGPKVDPAKAQEAISAVWRTTEDLHGTSAEKYLAKRGIYSENMPRSLRSHRSMRYYDGKAKKLIGEFPAMIAPVTNPDGRIVSLHRTFITSEGDKAPVPDAKRLMPATEKLNGAAIKLFPSCEVLGVGEGIETMLAVHAISRLPVWSCVSAVLLEEVAIPKFVRHVVIWADKDKGGRGQQAAEALADRLVTEGKSVEVLYPTQAIPEDAKGIDWLDVLNTYGIDGFPDRWRVWTPR